jgi:hypothetical protein
MPNKTKLNEGDIVDFSSYAGMYSDGARVAFMDRDGTVHRITATGGRPRQYTLDGKPITWEELKKVAGNKQLGRFNQGMTESKYNKDAVDKEIKKDPRIKGKEAKAIHGLLKGRTKEKAKVTEGVLDDQDDDGFMAKRQLYDIAKYAVELHRLIQDTDNLEPWIQAKITTAADYIDTVKHYMEYGQVRDAGDTADVMGPPDMADIDSIGGALDGMDMGEEAIVEYGDEDEGTELAGADILRYAALRGIISPERAKNPDPALDQAADSFAFDLGPVHEIGSSDVSIWLRQFIQQYRGAVEFDGPRAHLYESQIRAKQIYKKMLKGLK